MSLISDSIEFTKKLFHCRLPTADCRPPICSLLNVTPRIEPSRSQRSRSAIGNWQSTISSLVSQRHQWIDLHRASSREVTGQQRDDEQTDGHGGEGRLIRGLYFEQQRRD